MSGERTGPAPPHPMGRRRFLEYLLGFGFLATLAGVIIPIVGYIWPPKQEQALAGGAKLVATLVELPPGKGKVDSVGNRPVIVVNTPEAGVRAFSAVCTHLGCIVKWDEAISLIHCPCHDGRFSPVTGAVISGPPPTPLPSVAVRVEDDNIYVGG